VTRRAEDILGGLRDVPAVLEDPEVVARREDAACQKLEASIEAVPQERRRRRIARIAIWAALPAAAALALVVGWPARTRPEPIAASTGAAAAVAVIEQTSGQVTVMANGKRRVPGQPLEESDRIDTGASARAVLRLPSRARVVLEENTDLRLTRVQGPDERVDLGSGTARFDLPKLAVGSSFSVVTPDARVTVVGTAFSVRTAPGLTCVAVDRGQVVASGRQGQMTLGAGERWSSTGRVCDPAPEPMPVAPAARPRLAPRPLASASAAPEPSAGPLARQNELYTAAVRARSQGRKEEARRLLNRLLAEYPDSPLAEVARRERRNLE
jgi:ferric-dicitrate binding protein FerR (iron transport regulator)